MLLQYEVFAVHPDVAKTSHPANMFGKHNNYALWPPLGSNNIMIEGEQSGQLLSSWYGTAQATSQRGQTATGSS